MLLVMRSCLLYKISYVAARFSKQKGETVLNKSDFFHHLRDTIILLAGEIEIANLLERPDDITEADVNELRRFNCKLIDATKDRLVNINKIKVVVAAK